MEPAGRQVRRGPGQRFQRPCRQHLHRDGRLFRQPPGRVGCGGRVAPEDLAWLAARIDRETDEARAHGIDRDRVALRPVAATGEVGCLRPGLRGAVAGVDVDRRYAPGRASQLHQPRRRSSRSSRCSSPATSCSSGATGSRATRFSRASGRTRRCTWERRPTSNALGCFAAAPAARGRRTTSTSPGTWPTTSRPAHRPRAQHGDGVGERRRHLQLAHRVDGGRLRRGPAPASPTTQKATALARAFSHVGKPYDFEFDFSSSDKLVCTELVYQSYDGVLHFDAYMEQIVGRPAIPALQFCRKFAAERGTPGQELEFVLFLDAVPATRRPGSRARMTSCAAPTGRAGLTSDPPLDSEFSFAAGRSGISPSPVGAPGC